MKYAKCDLCEKECKYEEMFFLRENFRSPGIEDLCRECNDWVENVRGELHKKVPAIVKQEIQARKGNVPVTPVKKKRWFW